MEIKNNRNTSLEALRFFSMIQICCLHYNALFGRMKTGYLGVEFYFILAGFFIFINIRRKKEGVIQYSINKAKKFYTEYIVALILTYCVSSHMISKSYDSIGLLGEVLKFVSQLLFIQSTGPFLGGYNSPTWFFSILMWGGALIYLLTKNYQKFSIKILFPILILLYLTCCFNSDGKMTLEKWGIMGGVFPMELIRGCAEMGFGVLIGYIFVNYISKNKFSKVFSNLVITISIILYIWIVFRGRQFPQFVFILLPIIIWGSMIGETFLSKLFKNKIWLSLGKLSFAMFLIHIFLVRLIKYSFSDIPYFTYTGFIIYLVALIPISYLFSLFCNWLRLKINPKIIVGKV